MRSPQLYLVLEYRRPAAAGVRVSLGGCDEVQIGRGTERRTRKQGGVLHIEIPDERMSARHARLVRLSGGWAFEDLGSKNGSRVGGARAERALLGDGDRIELGESLLILRDEPDASDEDMLEPRAVVPGIATLIPGVARELERLARVARAEVPVLLLGESGTGKELAARALHALSGRAGRFVAVNCGALPETLVEAELFGHRRGAFSGAVEARPGLVRSADMGTLFLDEVGDLAASSQAALLRVLQEREVRTVGETEPVAVDVRIVAATHRDLEALAADERFRADLLARLDGYQARLAPLRERRPDLGVIVAALLAKLSPARALGFHPDAARALVAYDWPRNVRELEQALGAAIALVADGTIQLEHLPDRVREARDRKIVEVAPEDLSASDAALRGQLVALLEEHRGNVNAVARALGKDRTQIRRWLGRFGLDAARWR